MDYNKMKKDELIKALKEKDVAIAGFEETNKLLSKEKDNLTVKVRSLTKDCEGMTEECNNLRNKVNVLSDDLKKSNEERYALRIEKNKIKENLVTSEMRVVTLKRQRVILGIVTIAAILISIIF